ncbi:ornithine carbamoyltransferase [Ornithinimicrobium humiphilum]|uniref:Ornithine carbamoyltransferase n=1 Tax=Ornithinimicrobium humiphilum TaxID=125288 RepID=A0A543KKV8_9MICO|nr:ornithine carbamoyltransferase [Ornithinimicrobium humiphilum]TQM95660.1 ornithine carbamoyltransferase [Ornithinimicrobium humiphilum]
MAVNLKGRSLLSLIEETPEEIRHLVDLAGELKAARAAGQERRALEGRVIALVFEKTSTRTRSAFEVAAAHQGATTTFLDPGSTQIGHKESIQDTARVLGRMFDAIEYRGASQATVEELAHYSGVPVYNGLTDEWHPTQMLADALTMLEHNAEGRGLAETSFAYLGDARNNTGHSLLLLAAKLGMDVRIAAPEALQPSAEVVDLCRAVAAQTGASLTITADPHEAVRGVDYVHTDVWVSMGEPPEAWDHRIDLLLPYRVDAALMSATGNPEAKFMHCLPAFHDDRTAVGAALMERRPDLAEGVEVTHEVFESPASIVFDQAENRLHTIKALMVATLV